MGLAVYPANPISIQRLETKIRLLPVAKVRTEKHERIPQYKLRTQNTLFVSSCEIQTST